MKRVWKFSSDATRAKLLLFQSHKIHGFSEPKTTPLFITSVLPDRNVNTVSKRVSDIVPLFTAKHCYSSKKKKHLTKKVNILKNTLLCSSCDPERIQSILDDNSDTLNRRHPSGSVFIKLMNQLSSYPSLALQVFSWRRKRSNLENPMDAYQYSEGIKAAGRSENVDLAVKLFKEAAIKGIKTTSTYNALMGAFMVNGLADNCQSLFCDLKRDPTCDPDISTYNILLSIFGNMMLVDHMKATFGEIRKLNLAMSIDTYNHLIAGYITAWMWDEMEKVFQMLKSSPVKPDKNTYRLMLRGYANSGNLEKMEEMYSFISDHVNIKEKSLIRCMICAYCKSSEADRLEKIELLLKLIPDKKYNKWLNVLLIKLYAKEDCLEKMENAINEAFEHGTTIATKGILKCIIATYYRCNALEKLENFVRRSEDSGWTIYRSLYHCKLVMYGAQKPLHEMHNVLEDMENVKLYCTKKTFWIMYKAYKNRGQSSLVLKTLGQMFKHGYEVPLDAFPS